ncbi:MAG: AI-2E family transporter [Cardiobacteriaceae bacterium]|nr:AI-2E family transporter [Cardiobacteriaceae bacterium]
MKNTSLWAPISRFLSNPSLVALVAFGISLLAIFYFLGEWLFPVIFSVGLAYLLEGIIAKLERIGVRRMLAVTLVYTIFITAILYLTIVLIPNIIAQAKLLIIALPDYFHLVQQYILLLPQKFPSIFSETDVKNLLENINSEIGNYSKTLSSKIFTSLFVLIKVLVYAILVPLLTFFFLKDKKLIINWLARFLPKHHEIIKDIWAEVDIQIGNYIRGKFTEILVVWLLTFISLHIFGLQYSLLLSFMVGLSVLIPYIGATLATIPVLIIAYVQFGLTPEFYWLTGLYFIVQIIDGNIFVPLIFSEAVNIHPVAIIIAVLIFGGLWGFWGVFFAIPLATVVKAVMEAWHRYQQKEVEIQEEII